MLRVENDQLFIVDRKKVTTPETKTTRNSLHTLTLTAPREGGKQELIKYKGLQVAPAELEGILVAHPHVEDAAVVGIPRDGNELPRAYVVLAPDARGRVSEEDLKDHVRRQVSGYKQLRGGVVFVNAVPRSPSGKILRRQLRDLHLHGREGEQSKL